MKSLSPNNIFSFVARQLRLFREGSSSTRKRKLQLVLRAVARFPFQLIAVVPAIIIVLTARLIRPVFLIRFERMICWRLGHFVTNTELYLCELDAGLNKPRAKFFDIWYYPCEPCNRQIARMWGRVLHIGPEILFGLVDRINSLIPGGQVHQIGSNTDHDLDVHNLMDRFPAHLAFLPEEEGRGEAGLRQLGIPEGAPFVCITVRDSAYLQSQNKHIDWSRHGFRDCDIQDYIPAAQKLADLGYYVVRVGAVVNEAMNVDHPMIIDYATNGMRSDFMDVYLGAKCAFCVSNGTGFDAVPYSLRRPVLYVDIVPLHQMCWFSKRFLTTFKLHRLKGENRFMSFREIFESGAWEFFDKADYEAMGIELIESTPDEIAEVVLEMEARLNGKWQATEEDEELQKRFWALYPKPKERGEIRGRIGAHFLRRHKNLLG